MSQRKKRASLQEALAGTADSMKLQGQMRNHSGEMREIYRTYTREVSAIAYCPLQYEIAGYQQVVLCETGQYFLRDFRIDEGQQLYHIELELENQLQVWENDRLVPKQENVIITFTTRMETARRKFRPKLIDCRGCGATISLVGGGICQYCQTPVDMMAYDWVITGYHVTQA